jgi:hypothetical protein
MQEVRREILDNLIYTSLYKKIVMKFPYFLLSTPPVQFPRLAGFLSLDLGFILVRWCRPRVEHLIIPMLLRLHGPPLFLGQDAKRLALPRVENLGIYHPNGFDLGRRAVPFGTIKSVGGAAALA